MERFRKRFYRRFGIERISGTEEEAFNCQLKGTEIGFSQFKVDM